MTLILVEGGGRSIVVGHVIMLVILILVGGGCRPIVVDHDTIDDGLLVVT